MRLFVAINLPEATRGALHQQSAALRKAAPSVRWVQPETLHITLKFLGEVAAPDLAGLLEALRTSARAALGFSLRLGGFGAFPNLRRPRVFWLGAQGGQALPDLQAKVEAGLESLGFEREARPFHPHITLGRVNGAIAHEEVRRAERVTTEIEYDAVVQVRSIELMQSRLAPGGARYEIVESLALRSES